MIYHRTLKIPFPPGSLGSSPGAGTIVFQWFGSLVGASVENFMELCYDPPKYEWKAVNLF